MVDNGFARQAAVLQVIAARLRESERKEDCALQAFSMAIESIAADLICSDARHPRL